MFIYDNDDIQEEETKDKERAEANADTEPETASAEPEADDNLISWHSFMSEALLDPWGMAKAVDDSDEVGDE